DLNIKVGAKEVYKYGGKFAYEYRGTYDIENEPTGKCVNQNISSGTYVTANDICNWLGKGNCVEASGLLRIYVDSDCSGGFNGVSAHGTNGCTGGMTAPGTRKSAGVDNLVCSADVGKGNIDLQVNGKIENAKITFIGDGLEIDIINKDNEYDSCDPSSACGVSHQIPHPEHAFQTWAVGGARIYTDNGSITGYVKPISTTHQGYVKKASLSGDIDSNCSFPLSTRDPNPCNDPATGHPDFYVYVDDALSVSEDDYMPKRWEGPSPINPSPFNSNGKSKVKVKTNDSVTWLGHSYKYIGIDTFALNYTLSVPTRNPQVTVNGETVGGASVGELKDHESVTYNLTSLTQGINHLDFSTVGPGSVLSSPHIIDGSVGSGKFNYIITGDLTQTIDLASEINEYVHTNCEGIDCVVPIKFSGTGSTITFDTSGAAVFGADEQKCNPFGTPPTITDLHSEPGCIWPLISLSWTFLDTGDGMSAYQVEIWDHSDFTGTRLLDSTKITTTPADYPDGASFTYEVGELPISSTAKYYWRVRVWDSSDTESGWFDGMDTGIKLLYDEPKKEKNWLANLIEIFQQLFKTRH
ncbi:hypothetical protein KAU40_00405, partial [Candidatus Parcubacteria bacterium]|nr:hypothetical protein [Candidatus Parcubacteria bacterium]